MPLDTELGFRGAVDYKDAAPAALPKRFGGFEPFQVTIVEIAVDARSAALAAS